MRLHQHQSSRLSGLRRPQIQACKPSLRCRSAQGSSNTVTSTAVLHQEEPSTSANADESHSTSASACPVLRALKPLPTSNLSRLERTVLQFVNPSLLQTKTLNGRPFVETEFLFRPAMFLADVDMAKDLLAKEGQEIRVGWPPSVVALTGPNALINAKDVERHKYLRRLITPALRQEEVDAFLPRIQAVAETYLQRWVESCDAGNVVLAYPQLKKFTFEVITAVLVDEISDAEVEQLDHMFEVWLKSFFTAFTYDMPPFPFHYSMNARRGMIKIFQRHIHETRAKVAAPPSPTTSSTMSHASSTSLPLHTSNGNGNGNGHLAAPTTPLKRVSILERLITERDEAGKGLSDPEIIDNLITMFFAGHDTSASTLASALQLLASHPEAMEKLRAEQDALVAQYGTQITPKVLRKMPYTDALVREVLRYRVIIPGVMRVASEQGVEVEGHQVPPGYMINVALFSMIKNDPRFKHETGPMAGNVFNPDRFLSEEGQKVGSQVYFGIGNRICPGMALALAEIKVLLATLARGYNYKADWNTDFVVFPMPYPKNNLPVFLTRR